MDKIATYLHIHSLTDQRTRSYSRHTLSLRFLFCKDIDRFQCHKMFAKIRCYCSRMVDNRVPDFRTQSNFNTKQNTSFRKQFMLHYYYKTYFTIITVMACVSTDTRTFTSRCIAYIAEGTNIMAITKLTSMLSIAPIPGFASLTLPSLGIPAENKWHILIQWASP